MAESKLEALATELAATAENRDPKGVWISDRDVAAALNAKTQTIVRTRVPVQEVLASIDLAEWEALPDARRQFLVLVLSSDKPLDFTAPHFAAAVDACFPRDTATGTALAMVSSKAGSRAEALLGDGAVVTAADVERAKRVSEGKDPDTRSAVELTALVALEAKAIEASAEALGVIRG